MVLEDKSSMVGIAFRGGFSPGFPKILTNPIC